MFSIKEIIGDVRNWVVGYLMGGFLIGIFVVLRAVWAAMKREPLPWALLLVLSLIAIALFGVAIVNFIRTAKRHGKAQIPESNPEIELQSEGGLISARVTNRSDSEVRVEHLWIAAVDATGKKTLAKDRIRKFTRCAQMPHVM